eukprot:scaffold15313_cov132-Isochrysis_galbana.AAC.1
MMPACDLTGAFPRRWEVLPPHAVFPCTGGGWGVATVHRPVTELPDNTGGEEAGASQAGNTGG